MKKVFLGILMMFVLMPQKPALAENVSATRESLRGLEGVFVLVSVETLEPMDRDALAAVIAADVNLKLKLARVKSLSPDELNATAAMPQFQISVILDKVPSGGYSFLVFAELLQKVRVLQNPLVLQLLAPTWSSISTGGYLPESDLGRDRMQSIRDAVKKETDKFIEAFQSVNGESANAGY